MNFVIQKIFQSFLLSVFGLLLFTGCSNKTLQTQHYYAGYSKNDILYAGKLAFNMDTNNRYIVDSYRDKLEVTKIEPLLHTMQHKDYVFSVKEDVCGTTAMLDITASLGMYKALKHDVFAQEHHEFWNKIAFLLQEKNRIKVENITYARNPKMYEALKDNRVEQLYEKIITPTKQLDNCVIKSEFEKGAVRHNLKQGEQIHEIF
jgi:hypothetical protein